MSGMFDVDCPRTPDGDGDDDTNKTSNTAAANNNNATSHADGGKNATKAARQPPGGRPPRASSATPRAASRKQQRQQHRRTGSRTSSNSGAFSPRVSSRGRKSAATTVKSSGLEPEEYVEVAIAPSVPPAPGSGNAPPGLGMTSPRPPRSGNGAKRVVAASPPTSGNGNGGGGNLLAASPRPTQSHHAQRAPGSGNGGGRQRAHSTEAFGEAAAQTGDDGGDGNDDVEGNAAGIMGGNNNHHRRTGSGNWWREEIVDEHYNKGNVMEEYYGLNPRERRELYGPSPRQGERNQQQQQPMVGWQEPASGVAGQVGRAGDAGSTIGPVVGSGGLTGSGPGAASAANYNPFADDRSLSNVNLSSPGNYGGATSPGSCPSTPVAGSSSHGGSGGGVGGVANNLLKTAPFVWLSALVARNKPELRRVPSTTAENGAAYSDDDEEDAPNSPRVSFANDFQNDFHPSSIKRQQGMWTSMSPVQKMSMVTVWVALVCAILGVTVSQLSKRGIPDAPQAGPNEVNGLPELTAVETPSPTPLPTAEPTPSPTTPRPTRSPITQSPVAGYHSIHGKANDGTAHPTRSPITAAPSRSPTPPPTMMPVTQWPTNPPTASPTVGIQAVQSQPCTDVEGEYSNHLGNPKTCAWLNSKPGYTDRKDKNCGGVPVLNDDTGITTVYPTSELGRVCQATCGLYNGCATEPVTQSEIQQVGNLLRPRLNNNNNRQEDVGNGCVDQAGYFLNHLHNPKTCQWLYNDKPGKTDRKSKNCGGVGNVHPVTELGRACLGTCAPYHPTSRGEGCATLSVGSAGGFLRTYSSPSYSFSLMETADDGGNSMACNDGDGTYPDHKGAYKACSWLLGNGDEEYAHHRQEKNCGSDSHAITELGRECPLACQSYNDC